MVALLQFPCVLRGELFAVGIENNDDWQTESCGMPILGINILVVLLVHINHNNHKVVLQFLGDTFVRHAKLVQPVTPPTPIRAELQENVLALLLCDHQRTGDLV